MASTTELGTASNGLMGSFKKFTIIANEFSKNTVFRCDYQTLFITANSFETYNSLIIYNSISFSIYFLQLNLFLQTRHQLTKMGIVKL